MRLNRVLMRLGVAVAISTSAAAGGIAATRVQINQPANTFTIDSSTRSGGISRPQARPQFTRPHDNGSDAAGRTPEESKPAPRTNMGGITRPQSAPPPPAGSPAVNTGGITRPGTAKSPEAGTVFSRNSPVDVAIAKGHSAQALAQFRSDQAKFKAPPIGVPQSRQAAQDSRVWRTYGSHWGTEHDYYAARDAAFARSPRYHVYWENPPVYVVHARPSYGSFSGAFLGSLLAVGIVDGVMNASYADWAYSHRNDEAYRQWHNDMVEQAQSDPDVQQRLDLLDAKVNALQAENAPVTDKLPEDVDPSFVVSQDTVMMATTQESSSHWMLITVSSIVIVLGLAFIYMLTRRRSTLAI